eukprot:Seg2322.5 transcript_id=Seg2322.5/GoldUCD/mRNA.D3Y31 product="hypothetical protein" protein_id=Seg2322.5/GoldUCD/D3Y31
MEDFGDFSSTSQLLSEIDKMNVYNLRNFLLSKGITVAKCKKADLVKLAKAAINLGLEGNVDFHEDSLDLSERLIIKGVNLPDPFSLDAKDFTARMDHVPPFGIEDIFNFLIFKSVDYDRQKVASYKAFEDYGLFQDGYVEELIVMEVQSHFIFRGKVRPTMVTETKQKEKFYQLWFVIDGERFSKDDSNSVIKWKPTAGSIFSAFCQCPGGQDGACKHIAASLYSLHDSLHPSTGPTDELCYVIGKKEKLDPQDLHPLLR